MVYICMYVYIYTEFPLQNCQLNLLIRKNNRNHNNIVLCWVQMYGNNKVLTNDVFLLNISIASNFNHYNITF